MRAAGVLLVLLALTEHTVWAETLTLQEKPRVGAIGNVSVRVELEGTLTPPAEAGKPAPKPVALKGDSALEYDERIHKIGAGGEVTKTVRIYKRMDFRRTVAGQGQDTSLRPAVKRLVVLRKGNTEVPFSPDGPLLWGEIDQVRTDVFTPALVGLLPDKPVRIGDRWKSTLDVVRELTDMESIDEGSLECKLEKVEDTGKGRRARVTFSGTVKGMNEDGPNTQKLSGHFYFDMTTNSISELLLNGVHSLVDKDGKEVGRIEGRFALMRSMGSRCPELADAAVKSLVTEPNADNTRLLYDNPDLGVRFLYPRRWRVVGVRGTQVVLDGSDGSGLLLTFDPPEKAVSADEFLKESRGWMEKQKGKVLRVVAVSRVRATPPLDHFALETEMGEQKSWVDYYVSKQPGGGVTFAARLPLRDLTNLRQEANVLARSIVITKTIKEPKK